MGNYGKLRILTVNCTGSSDSESESETNLESTTLKQYRMNLEGSADQKESTRGDHGVESGERCSRISSFFQSFMGNYGKLRILTVNCTGSSDSESI
jgi:hypothetical protein